MSKPAAIWIFALLLLISPALADEPVTDLPVDAGDAPAALALDSDIPPSPLMLEIQTLLRARLATRRQLEAQAAESTDAGQALQLQRRLQEQAIQTELQVMRIQVEHLRRAGRVESAAALEAQLQTMIAPRPRPEPVDRPAPLSTVERR